MNHPISIFHKQPAYIAGIKPNRMAAKKKSAKKSASKKPVAKSKKPAKKAPAKKAAKKSARKPAKKIPAKKKSSIRKVARPARKITRKKPVKKAAAVKRTTRPSAVAAPPPKPPVKPIAKSFAVNPRPQAPPSRGLGPSRPPQPPRHTGEAPAMPRSNGRPTRGDDDTSTIQTKALTLDVTINIGGDITATLIRDGVEVDVQHLDETAAVTFDDARRGDVLNIQGASSGEVEYFTDRRTDPPATEETPRKRGPGGIFDSLDIL
jgi:hypothetical protein